MKERKSLRPEGTLQVRSSSARMDPTLNREIQTKIGQQLRAVYDDIVDQGVPDRFAELLRNLDMQAGRTKVTDKDSGE
ncbi:NepR family anti-sigma factor [Rhodoplanes azumiensis]|uniref:NepR family anti-sigma factor n=1 Tax=Rhodoplanes azumiensis TaxID=1897628 RepID=A0ABW5AP11_9BRAD